MFHAKPIIAYSIEAARRAGIYGSILVSTDDDEIKSIALSLGAGVLHRPEHLAQDHIGTQEVMAHACEAACTRADVATCIYATAPLMLAGDLWDGVALLKRRPGMDYVFTVGTDPLRDAGQWYTGWAGAFIDRRPLVSSSAVLYPLPPERVMDINEPQDWAMAELMYEQLQRRAA